MSKKTKTDAARPQEPIPLEDQIDRLKARARELGVDTETIETPDFEADTPAELRHAFWKDVVAFEQADPVSPFDQLELSGIELPEPDSLDDAALGESLWGMIRGLAFLGTFLHHTDHLSDRELYALLWHESLREPTVLMPDNPNFGYHLDLTGSGSDEDVEMNLRFYADEEEREHWAELHPDYAMPEALEPPFDRDRFLPEQTLAGVGAGPAF